MADRTAYSIVSCTAVFPSIGLVDAYNFPRSSCVKHLALTAILKHSGPSDARDWFTRCSTVQIQVWSYFDRKVTTHIIEECGWD